MPDDPVITAPINFSIAINALAKSAPSTASIRRVLQVSNLKAPVGLSRKNSAVAICVICGFLCVPLRISAFSALKRFFNAEIAEIRRGTQRRISRW
jgi:hypothetical protein